MLLALLLAGAAVAAPVDVVIQSDPRVEVVSVLLRLADRAPAVTAYQRDADAAFARFASHPAVMRAKKLVAGDPHADPAVRLALDGSDAVFQDELRDFKKESSFERFYGAHARERAQLERAARAAARSDASAEALAAYLGTPLSGRYRFVLAPLLPEAYETNFQIGGRWYWIHAGVHGGSGQDFMFHGFGNGPVHELAHTVTDALAAGRPTPPGRPPTGCNDNAGPSWTACVQEHLVYAVTLRLLARAGDDGGYREALADYTSRGFPYLPALCARLQEYERARGRYKTLADFYPRLEAVFQEKELR